MVEQLCQLILKLEKGVYISPPLPHSLYVQMPYATGRLVSYFIFNHVTTTCYVVYNVYSPSQTSFSRLKTSRKL